MQTSPRPGTVLHGFNVNWCWAVLAAPPSFLPPKSGGPEQCRGRCPVWAGVTGMMLPGGGNPAGDCCQAPCVGLGVGWNLPEPKDPCSYPSGNAVRNCAGLFTLIIWGCFAFSAGYFPFKPLDFPPSVLGRVRGSRTRLLRAPTALQPCRTGAVSQSISFSHPNCWVLISQFAQTDPPSPRFPPTLYFPSFSLGGWSSSGSSGECQLSQDHLIIWGCKLITELVPCCVLSFDSVSCISSLCA